MRHRAFGIVIEGSEEAFDAFLLVEAKAPIRTQVDPALGFQGDDLDTILPCAPRSK